MSQLIKTRIIKDKNILYKYMYLFNSWSIHFLTNIALIMFCICLGVSHYLEKMLYNVLFLSVFGVRCVDYSFCRRLRSHTEIIESFIMAQVTKINFLHVIQRDSLFCDLTRLSYTLSKKHSVVFNLYKLCVYAGMYSHNI